MNFKQLMVISSMVALGFGMAFVLVPGPMTALYDLRVGSAGLLMVQLFGAELVGYGLLAGLVRNARDSELRRAILLAFCITDTLGFLAALLGQLTGAMNALGWSIVGIYLLLASAFGYFCFLRSSAAQ